MSYVFQGIDHMDRLITSLLAYAQVDSVQLMSADVNFTQILHETIVILAIDSTIANVTSDDLPTVQGDSVLLLELMQNLIANALKYRTAGIPQIHISSQETAEECTISVRDNGIGIESEHTEKIFRPFTRLHGADVAGSGLGLAVCRRIVERHGGRIWVESAAGLGATFFFTLPKILPGDDRCLAPRLPNCEN